MKTKNKKNGEKSKKLLPSDFYIENGLRVMTEEYHIRRGYCCGSGCRHCCFSPKHTKGSTILQSEFYQSKKN